MKEDCIFIHIPKTGGTTINTALNNTYWQTPGSFNYRHINKETFVSNSKDIFDSANQEKYSQYKIFMMLREPFDRLLSEYYFLNTRSEFTSLLKNKPKTFLEYVENPQTQNYMCKFLLGRKIYDSAKVTEGDLNTIIEGIEKLPIYTGIYEFFQESMGYYEDKTGIKWPKLVESKRVSLNRKSKEEFDGSTRNRVLELNSMDVNLYEFALKKFMTVKDKYKNFKIEFITSKYNHVLAFSARATLFEFCMNNKAYLKQNLVFFRDFTFHLHKDLKITDGKQYCEIWNQTFIEHIRLNFPDSPFLNAIESAFHSSTEALDQTIAIGEAMDSFFEKEGKKADKYFKTMSYDKTKLVLVEAKKSTAETKGFWTKLFGK